MGTKLQALIFDVDGTLAETERDGHRVAFNQAFQSAGLPWHWSVDFYSELLQVAGGKERMRFYLDQYAPPVPEVRDWTAFIADLHRAKTHRYKAILTSGNIQLRPGVKGLIKAARQSGLTLAIATTSRQENALTLLQTAIAPDAPSWFEVIAAGDVVPQKKPAADIYDYTLDKMGLAPSSCLAFEDTEHGVISAADAGITTVATVSAYAQDQDFSRAALVLDHLGTPRQPSEVLSGLRHEKPYFDLALAAALLNRRSRISEMSQYRQTPARSA